MVAKKDDQITVLDFFPSWWKDQEDDELDDAEAAQAALRAKAERLFASFGGTKRSGS